MGAIQLKPASWGASPQSSLWTHKRTVQSIQVVFIALRLKIEPNKKSNLKIYSMISRAPDNSFSFLEVCALPYIAESLYRCNSQGLQATSSIHPRWLSRAHSTNLNWEKTKSRLIPRCDLDLAGPNDTFVVSLLSFALLAQTANLPYLCNR